MIEPITNEDVKDINEPLPNAENSPSHMANPVVANISKRLEGAEVAKSVDETAPKAVENNKIDLTTLTADQIATLKQMFQSAPDVVAKPKGNTVLNLREIDGKIVIEFKNSYMTLKSDTVNRRDIEIPMLPIRFLGETEFINVELYQFHNAKRVECEVVGHKTEIKQVPAGKTIHKDTGLEVPMNNTFAVEYYDIKLPNGKVVTITNELANG